MFLATSGSDAYAKTSDASLGEIPERNKRDVLISGVIRFAGIFLRRTTTMRGAVPRSGTASLSMDMFAVN